MTPTLTTLLNSYLLTSDQGNPAFCSVHLIESYAPFRLGKTAEGETLEYVVRPEPLAFRGQSRATFEETP